MTITARPGDAPDNPGTEGVLFVEDDEDLRGLFVQIVGTFLARRCLGVGSYGEMVELGDAALCCGVAVLDINLGANQPSGIDAYAWLRNHGYHGRIVFLTGHASSHPLVVEAHRLGDAEVYSKPIDLDRMLSMITGPVH